MKIHFSIAIMGDRMGFFNKIKSIIESDKNKENSNKKDNDNVYVQDEEILDLDDDVQPQKTIEGSDDELMVINDFNETDRNFKYLDDLIHSGVKHVVLDSDIVLDDDEVEYVDGIKLDIDDLIIDGNGYSIDAKCQSRIFNVLVDGITFKNLIFKNGHNTNKGGAVYSENNSVSFHDCTFENNDAVYGGAIYLEFNKIELVNCKFNSSFAHYGGAVNADISHLENCIFAGNRAEENAGAIAGFVEKMENCTFESNSAKNGGVIYTSSLGEVSINNSNFINNHAINRGGVFHSVLCDLKIQNSAFSDNSADSNGGSIYHTYGHKLNVTNCVFENSVSNMGGAIFIYALYEDACLFGSDFINNTSDVSGDSLYSESDSYLNIFECNFKMDVTRENLIHNTSTKTFTIEKSSFDVDFDFFKKCIVNNGNELNLKECDFKDNEVSESHMVVEDKDSQYIMDLIEKGNKEITLDCNIRGNFSINEDDVVIDGKGHFVDLYKDSNENRSCHFKGRNIILKNFIFFNGFGWDYNEEGGALVNKGYLTLINCTFKENHTKEVGGGAISNEGTLKLINCKFFRNTARDEYGRGGAIINNGILELEKCSFAGNMAEEYGGAIANERGILKLKNCNFHNNSVKKSQFFVTGKGGAIYNRASLICVNCKFKDNASTSGSSIWSDEYIEIIGSDFYNDSYPSHIYQDEQEYSNLLFLYSRLHGGFLHIENGKSSIVNSQFDNDDEYSIYNENGILKINGIRFDKKSLNKIVSNKNILKISKLNDFEDKIDLFGGATLEYYDDYLSDDCLGFKSLDEVINSNIDDAYSLENENIEICLNNDFVLKDYEQDFYEGGIELNQDNLIIDGQGHTIDANELSRIFLINANNVTLKNIIFKNGRYFKNYLIENNYYDYIQFNSTVLSPKSPLASGGAVIRLSHGCSLKIDNCQFIDNYSYSAGGTIENNGDILEIINSEFKNNASKKQGLSICNRKDSSLKLTGCTFELNSENELIDKYSHDGVIYIEDGDLTVCDSKIYNFDNNAAIYSSGNGSLNLKDSDFISNKHGLYCLGDARYNLNNCIFNDNKKGIFICGKSSLELDDCIFELNMEGIFSEKNNHANLKNCIFKSNKNHALIYMVEGNLSLENCDFQSNCLNPEFPAGYIYSNYDGAIYFSATKLILKNCSFNSNQSIHNYSTIVISHDEIEKYDNIVGNGQIDIIR